jgi:hypothetical protein
MGEFDPYYDAFHVGGKHAFDKFNMFEAFLLYRVQTAVWLGMYRASLFDRLKIRENIITTVKNWHEPQILVPIYSSNAARLYCDKSLAYYTKAETNDFRDAESSLEKFIAAKNTEGEIYFEMIQKYAPPERHNYYCDLVRFRISRNIYFFADGLNAQVAGESLKSMVLLARRILCMPDLHVPEDVRPGCLWWYVTNKVINKRVFRLEDMPGINKITAYGVMGGPSTYKKLLLASPLRPDVFWDIAKTGDVDGIPICKPDFDSLTGDDLVVVTLTKTESVKQVKAQLERTPAKYILLANIKDYLSNWVFEDGKYE